MKLYATVSSERASKGQGGNEFIDVSILNADRLSLMELRVVPDGNGAILRIMTRERDSRDAWRTQEIELKGNKQKV